MPLVSELEYGKLVSVLTPHQTRPDISRGSFLGIKNEHHSIKCFKRVLFQSPVSTRVNYNLIIPDEIDQGMKNFRGRQLNDFYHIFC